MKIPKAQILNHLNQRRRKIVYISLLNVVILMFGSYLWNNQPLYTGEDITEYAHIQWFWEVLGGRTVDDELDSALFVNVAYDKQLVKHRDDIGETIGVTDVTDRKKLLKILKKAEEYDHYKYIILDVRFEDANSCADDAALFSQIRKMKRIVVATHKDIKTPKAFPSEKAALADYYATITATNFERYEYLHANVPSVPLYAFQELTGKSMKQHFCFTTCDGRLCQKCLFLKFPSQKFDKVMSNGDQRYYDLGVNMLDNLDDFKTLSDGKIVIIGNCEEDLHDTYIGMKPGPYILYKALRALERGDHYVNWWTQLLFASIFFIISCLMLMHKPLTDRISFVRRSKSHLLHFAVTFLSCGMLMTTLDVLLFFEGHIHSILFPSLYFGLMKLVLTYRRTRI